MQRPRSITQNKSEWSVTFFLQLLTAGSCNLHKMAASLVRIRLIQTSYDLPVMRVLHLLDPATESVKQMEHGVEPPLLVKVKKELMKKENSYNLFAVFDNLTEIINELRCP